MKKADSVSVLTFDEWKLLPEAKEMIAKLEVEDCDECDGSGTHVCDCGDEHGCGYCNGDGKLYNEPELLLHTAYENILCDELNKLKRWIGQIP